MLFLFPVCRISDTNYKSWNTREGRVISQNNGISSMTYRSVMPNTNVLFEGVSDFMLNMDMIEAGQMLPLETVAGVQHGEYMPLCIDDEDNVYVSHYSGKIIKYTMTEFLDVFAEQDNFLWCRMTGGADKFHVVRQKPKYRVFTTKQGIEISVVEYRQIPDEAVQKYVEDIATVIDRGNSLGLQQWDSRLLAMFLKIGQEFISKYDITMYDYLPVYHGIWKLLVALDLDYTVTWGLSIEKHNPVTDTRVKGYPEMSLLGKPLMIEGYYSTYKDPVFNMTSMAVMPYPSSPNIHFVLGSYISSHESYKDAIRKRGTRAQPSRSNILYTTENGTVVKNVKYELPALWLEIDTIIVRDSVSIANFCGDTLDLRKIKAEEQGRVMVYIHHCANLQNVIINTQLPMLIFLLDCPNLERLRLADSWGKQDPQVTVIRCENFKGVSHIG